MSSLFDTKARMDGGGGGGANTYVTVLIDIPTPSNGPRNEYCPHQSITSRSI